MAEIVGNRIKVLRQELKMNQEQLAQKIGVARQAVNNYENEKSNPEISTLVKLANVLSCSVDYLLGISENRQHDIDENADDWAKFKNSIAKYDETAQSDALSTFVHFLDSVSNYVVNPNNRKRLFEEALEALYERANHIHNVQYGIELLEKGTDISAEKVVELLDMIHKFGADVLKRDIRINELGHDFITAYFQ